MLWMTTMVVLAAAPPVASPADSVPADRVPAAIEEHYRDYNLINGFSTAAERRTLAAAREAPADPRLARIARLMRRVEADVEEVDPGILGDARTRLSQTTFRSDLLRITSFRVDEDRGEAWVHLDALALDHGSSVTLVGQYDTLAGGDKRPSVAEMLAVAGGRYIRTEEIHRWTRVDGEWRRAAATLVFVAQ